MAVYIDPLFTWPLALTKGAQARRVAAKNNGMWCHMWADTPDELHAFAIRIGLKRAWAQFEGTPRLHYDLTPGRRLQALKLGAIEVNREERQRQMHARGVGPAPEEPIV